MAKKKRILKPKYGVRRVIDYNAPAEPVAETPRNLTSVEDRMIAQHHEMNADVLTEMTKLYDRQLEVYEAMKDAESRANEKSSQFTEKLRSELTGLLRASLPPFMTDETHNFITSYGEVIEASKDSISVTVSIYGDDHEALEKARDERYNNNRYAGGRNDYWPVPATSIDHIFGYIQYAGKQVQTIDEERTQKHGEDFNETVERCIKNFVKKATLTLKGLTMQDILTTCHYELTDKPVGWHYPLKRNVKSWLRKLGIDARNDSSDIAYLTCGNGEDKDPIKAFSVVGPGSSGGDLREFVKFNQYMVKAEEYLKERDILAEREDEENENQTKVTFKLKLVKGR